MKRHFTGRFKLAPKIIKVKNIFDNSLNLAISNQYLELILQCL